MLDLMRSQELEVLKRHTTIDQHALQSKTSCNRENTVISACPKNEGLNIVAIAVGVEQ